MERSMVNFVTFLFRRLKNVWRVRRLRVYGNEVVVAPEDFARIKLKVRGTGNVIRIGKMRAGSGAVIVSAYANASRIEIGEGVSVSRELVVNVWQNHPNFGSVTGCLVRIGEGTSVESLEIGVLNSHASVLVGAQCMISFGVTLYQTDAHPIYAKGTDRIVNRVSALSIGDHVWVGARVTILKNSIIPDGCLIGWGSVVSGRFADPHVVIAGNPARQVSSRKIDWARSDPRYIANEAEEIR